jgi:hypothetical protein
MNRAGAPFGRLCNTPTPSRVRAGDGAIPYIMCVLLDFGGCHANPARKRTSPFLDHRHFS